MPPEVLEGARPLLGSHFLGPWWLPSSQERHPCCRLFRPWALALWASLMTSLQFILHNSNPWWEYLPLSSCWSSQLITNWGRPDPFLCQKSYSVTKHEFSFFRSFPCALRGWSREVKVIFPQSTESLLLLSVRSRTWLSSENKEQGQCVSISYVDCIYCNSLKSFVLLHGLWPLWFMIWMLIFAEYNNVTVINSFTRSSWMSFHSFSFLPCNVLHAVIWCHSVVLL